MATSLRIHRNTESLNACKTYFNFKLTRVDYSPIWESITLPEKISDKIMLRIFISDSTYGIRLDDWEHSNSMISYSSQKIHTLQ